MDSKTQLDSVANTLLPDTTGERAISIGDGDYAPLDLHTLHGALTLPSELYIRVSGQYVLYRGPSVAFTAADRERLLNAGVSALWITTRPDRRSQAQLRALLDQPDDALPSVAKAGLLYNSALAIARHTTAHGMSQEAFDDVRTLVSTTVSHMANNNATFAALLSLMHHDFSVYTHAVVPPHSTVMGCLVA